jgi:hypothetical protein
MPRPLRHRLLPVLAAAGIGGALLAPGTALAATPTVVFHGGCGLLGVGASSRPDTGGLTVGPGGTVTFVNRLGQSADLMINGSDRATVPADSQIGVVFRQGRTSVSLIPACLLGGGGAGSVTITVGAAGASNAGGAHGRTPNGSKSTEARATPSASPAAGASAASDPAAPAPAVDDGGLFGDSTAASPDPVPTSDTVAVGAAMPGPPVHKGPAGILVFVAAICVVGVSIAAGRAILAQRAIRAVAS